MIMVFPYWEINPEELLKKKKNNIESSPQERDNLYILIQAYKEASEEVYEIIKNITEQNFVKQLELFFDREAYLAEIYFYLKEGGGLLEVDKNILDVVNKEYILSYYTHLESDGAQNSISEPILKVWLNREYSKAFNKRFSN